MIPGLGGVVGIWPMASNQIWVFLHMIGSMLIVTVKGRIDTGYQPHAEDCNRLHWFYFEFIMFEIYIAFIWVEIDRILN